MIDFDGYLNYTKPSLDQIGEIIINDMWSQMQSRWNNIMRIIFDLVYVGHFTAEYIESISPIERDWLYQELIERKEAESKSMSEAFKR